MHKVADELEEACGLPLLHIADATADAILADGRDRVGLLATAFTMEQDFYTGRLAARGIDVLVPEEDGPRHGPPRDLRRARPRRRPAGVA